MTTRLLLIGSALFLGVPGLLLCFAPAELAQHMGWPAPPALLLLLQGAGGLALGLALVGWMSKGMHVGGVYGRPLVMGHLVCYTVAGLAVLRSLLHGELPPAGWALAVPLLVFAALFGRLLFAQPSPGKGD